MFKNYMVIDENIFSSNKMFEAIKMLDFVIVTNSDQKYFYFAKNMFNGDIGSKYDLAGLDSILKFIEKSRQ